MNLATPWTLDGFPVHGAQIVGWWDVTPGWHYRFYPINRFMACELENLVIYESRTFVAQWMWWSLPLILDFNGSCTKNISWSGVHPGLPFRTPIRDIVNIPELQRDGFTFAGWQKFGEGQTLSTEEVMGLHVYPDYFICRHLQLYSYWQNVMHFDRDYTEILRAISLVFVAVWEPATQGNTPCPTTNLARAATMNASSSQGVRTPDRANNGIHSGAVTNSWFAAGIGHEWLEVNFGELRNFNHIRIYQGGNRITDYRFEYSIDGVNWTTFHCGDGMRIMEVTPDAYYFTHPSTIQAQFVRLVSERSIGVTPIAVFEFEVYYLP